MIFALDAIIAFVTEFMTLEPGDLLATGTPPGVGPMEPGSVVCVDISGIGRLENRVTREAP
jgi:2-keto-4-pentenoate hydratase/2-oxohepta-3-ene-1,7-dioic acid hydratase in catechol pathway